MVEGRPLRTAFLERLEDRPGRKDMLRDGAGVKGIPRGKDRME